MRTPESKTKKKPRKKRPKPKAPGARKDDLTLDLSNPEKANRVDWVQDLISLGLSKLSITNRLTLGRESNEQKGITPIKKISRPEAYRYFDLTMAVLAAEAKQDVDQKRIVYKNRLRGLGRQAQSSGQVAVAVHAMTLEAAFDGVGPLIGRDAQPAKPAERPPEQMSAEELDNAIKAEQAREKKA